jgi:hypothetical protein
MMMIGKARKTNILRPVYRLGWLAIWSVWLVVLLYGVPAWVPYNDSLTWIVLTVLATTVAYGLHRFWDYIVTGRPLPWFLKMRG